MDKKLIEQNKRIEEIENILKVDLDKKLNDIKNYLILNDKHVQDIENHLKEKEKIIQKMNMTKK